MKATPNASLGRMAALAMAAALAGCAAPQSGPTAGEPVSGPFYAQEATTGGNAAGSATRHSDEEAMCAMHRNMGNASSEEARRLQGMSPEQRRQHMEMMRRHCP